MENYTGYFRNKCDLQQVHVPLHPLHSPLHIGKATQLNPIQDWCWRCKEGVDFDVSAAQILPALPALVPWGCQIKAAALLQRAEWFAKKKEESLPKRKLTEHLGCVLAASPWVLAGSGSVAHADLLAMRAPVPLSFPQGSCSPALRQGCRPQPRKTLGFWPWWNTGAEQQRSLLSTLPHFDFKINNAEINCGWWLLKLLCRMMHCRIQTVGLE